MEAQSSQRKAQLSRTGALFLTLLCCLAFAAPAKSAELESRFARFDNIKVHYQTSGKGKDALVFVHGWTCNADFWRGQTAAFSGARVIAIDLPGHGKSDKPQTDYTMAYFAKSIEAVMRDAGVTRAVLVGHSMGTPVVRQFYRLYPEKTLALVFVDGGLRPLATKEQAAQFTVMLQTNYKVVAPQMVEGMLKPIKDENLKGEIRASMQATPDHVAISAMVEMMDEKLYEKDSIKVPVLAVLAKSPLWPNDTEQYLRSLAPKLDFYMWENVSHFLMMEKPEEFNRTLQAFLVKNKFLKN